MDAATARNQEAGTGGPAIEQREAEQAGEGAVGDRNAATRDHRPRQAAEPPRRWEVAETPIGTHETSKPTRPEAAPVAHGCKRAFRPPGRIARRQRAHRIGGTPKG